MALVQTVGGVSRCRRAMSFGPSGHLRVQVVLPQRFVPLAAYRGRLCFSQKTRLVNFSVCTDRAGRENLGGLLQHTGRQSRQPNGATAPKGQTRSRWSLNFVKKFTILHISTDAAAGLLAISSSSSSTALRITDRTCWRTAETVIRALPGRRDHWPREPALSRGPRPATRVAECWRHPRFRAECGFPPSIGSRGRFVPRQDLAERASPPDSKQPPSAWPRCSPFFPPPCKTDQQNRRQRQGQDAPKSHCVVHAGKRHVH